jgi:hypothetical protein
MPIRLTRALLFGVMLALLAAACGGSDTLGAKGSQDIDQLAVILRKAQPDEKPSPRRVLNLLPASLFWCYLPAS